MSLKEIEALVEDHLGRKLNSDERDWLYIRKLTGAWGFQGDSSISRISELKGVTHHSFTPDPHYNDPELDGREGDTRYVARHGNPIEWHPVKEILCNSHVGVLCIPTRDAKDGKIYCAQFVGSKIFRIWMTLSQVEKVMYKLAQNKSLLSAVEQSLDIPLTDIERDIINKVMRN